MSELDDLVHRKQMAPAVGTLTYILFGPILWALQLTIVYGGHTLACTTAMPDGIARPMVLVVSVFVALVLVVFLLADQAAAGMLGLADDTPGRRTYHRLSRLISCLALVAIVWTGLTALIVASCAQGR